MADFNPLKTQEINVTKFVDLASLTCMAINIIEINLVAVDQHPPPQDYNKPLVDISAKTVITVN